ncbi:MULTISPECIES: amidohydrolase family protein [Micrococcaceae]|uniref:amidohydrolase family protein n=1 Tax=unclassified Kocuria TaxID=2649579 RepID=UPI001012D01E|nr:MULTISPECIES: amidohydrolase family protein [unclassified Kocuria]
MSNNVEAPLSDAGVQPYLAELGLSGLIDLHVHFMPDRVQQKVWSFFDHVGHDGGPAWPINYRYDDDERVRILRDIGVTSYTTLNYAHRPGMAQWLNEYSAQFASTHDDAIHSGTFYPEPDVESVVRESLDSGARIFKIHIQVGGFSALDPYVNPAWGMVAEAGAPVVIHCGHGPHQGKYTGVGPIRELVKRHPDLILIIAHAGLPEYDEFAELALRNPNVYLDTTMVGTSFMERIAPSPADYGKTLAALDGKIVLGTDFPSIPYSYSHQIEVLYQWDLGEEWMRNLLWETPRRLVGIR